MEPEVKLGDAVLVRGPATNWQELKGTVEAIHDNGSLNIEADRGDAIVVLHGVERNDATSAQVSFAAWRPLVEATEAAATEASEQPAESQG